MLRKKQLIKQGSSPKKLLMYESMRSSSMRMHPYGYGRTFIRTFAPESKIMAAF